MSQIGESMYAKALELAKATSALDGFVAHIANIKEEFNGAPVHLAMSLISSLDEEQINSLPRIGSKEKDTNNPDLFMWRDPSNPDAAEKEISFYVAWADGTGEGQRIKQERDWLTRLSTPGMMTDDIPQEYKDKYSNPDLRAKRKDRLDTRRGNVRKAYKQSIQVIHKMDDINELAAVACKVYPGDEPGTWDSLIRVHSTVPGREDKDYEDYTAQTFLKLDAAKAAEGGGTLAALKATIARAGNAGGRQGSGQGQQAGIPALAEIKTPETLDKVMVAVHSYLDAAFRDKKGDEYARLLKAVTGPGSQALVKTLGDVRGMIDDLFKMDKVAHIYAVACEEEAKAIDSTAKANAAKVPV